MSATISNDAGPEASGGQTALPPSRESQFLAWLEQRAQEDSRVRAVLRRSLAFEPGTCVQAYPYVEPFVRDGASGWERQAYYLTAGLWAMNSRAGTSDEPFTLAAACARHAAVSGSASTEQRFVNLLDADIDQLPYRLRQMVALLKDYTLDFPALLRDLLFWAHDARRTQSAWARTFFRRAAGESSAGV